jgi:hypothetical protein
VGRDYKPRELKVLSVDIMQKWKFSEFLEQLVEVSLNIVATWCVRTSGICIARNYGSGFEMESHLTRLASRQYAELD